METEKWCDIPGYEGLYAVSNKGRVKDLWKPKGKEILPQFEDGIGYRGVNLRRNGISRKCKVHRLVALAFLPNPENKPQVNHKDSCRSNNNVENLEWCTGSENMKHGYDFGFHWPTGCKPVVQMDMEGNDLATFASVSEAARAVNTNPTNIREQIKGNTSHCKGYKWRFANYADVYPAMPRNEQNDPAVQAREASK